MTEQDIQSLIRVELSKTGKVFRTNSGTAYDRFGNVIKLLPKGFPDLLYFGKDGRMAFIEVKTPTGKVRPEQEAFLTMMSGYGFKTGVARSVKDAVDIINGRSPNDKNA